MEGRIIPLRIIPLRVRKQTIRLKTVYFYLSRQARFNCNRVLTSVSMPIYCLTADEVRSSRSQILASSPLLGKTFRLLHRMFGSEGFENQKNDILHLWFVFQNYTCSFLSVRKMTTANCLFLLRSRQLDEACLKFFPKLCSTFSLGRNWKGESVVTPSLRLKH